VFRNRFSEAFNAYIAILRVVENRILITLGLDSPNGRIRNNCPCCNHRVPDEPPLEYDQILSIDGGSSLKRLRDAGVTQPNNFKSDYYIEPDEVDNFKLEADKKSITGKKKGRSGNKNSNTEQEDEDHSADVALEVGEGATEVNGEGAEWIVKNVQVEPGLEGDATDLSHCAARWKVNADDEKGGMFSCSDEVGIFIAVCRHRHAVTRFKAVNCE